MIIVLDAGPCALTRIGLSFESLAAWQLPLTHGRIAHEIRRPLKIPPLGPPCCISGFFLLFGLHRSDVIRQLAMPIIFAAGEIFSSIIGSTNSRPPKPRSKAVSGHFASTAAFPIQAPNR